MPATRTEGDALDRLEYENNALRELLRAFANADLDRRQHGEVISLFTEHLAIREAAREYVVESIGAIPELRELSERWQEGTTERRRRLTRLEELTRGVAPVNVNQGQDVDHLIEEIRPSLVAELDREESVLVPAVKEGLGPERRAQVLPSARFVVRHAPTHPGVHERRWYERFGPLVRLHALYDFLRGFPSGGAKPSAEVAVPGEGEVPSPTGDQRR